jgi:hypothetical protein
VAKVAAWQTPMRMNDTTRTYFERLATLSTAEDAARYTGENRPKQTSQHNFKSIKHHSRYRVNVSLQKSARSAIWQSERAQRR